VGRDRGGRATLANPGGFIPIALKDISQLKPSAGEYIALWVAGGSNEMRGRSPPPSSFCSRRRCCATASSA
jgi:hypothetical protein